VHTLDVAGCYQAGVTDAAFAHLRGVHTLDMSGCVQAGVTDAAFAHLASVRELTVCYSSAAITGAGFAGLGRGAARLTVSDRGLRDAAVAAGLAARFESYGE
jgi:hypothetical protein